MDITLDAPGWEEFEPAEGVRCKIKRLTFEEDLEWQSDAINLQDSKSDIFSEVGRKYFRKYVGEFEGLSINGTKVTKADELLDPGIRGNSQLRDIYMACMFKFFALNTVSEDEEKK